MITYKKADRFHVCPALELAWEVFLEFDAGECEPEAVAKFRADIVNNKAAISNWMSGKTSMYIACDGEQIVGVIGEKWNNGHINILFVKGSYHRRGIATQLMNHMVCDLKQRGFDKITVFSSGFALPFYRQYGFAATDSEHHEDGFVFTPMEYTPNEIWDILDEHGRKTGRLIERGRAMVMGDYHLVVHVWKHNRRGQWLINKRSNRGNAEIDGKWETTGGSALAGEDSLAAALRETKEELGVDLGLHQGALFRRNRKRENGRTWFQDVWVFEADVPIDAVCLQAEETCDAKWASTEEIREMMAAGEFLDGVFYPYFEEMVQWLRKGS
ncbi:MAG: GNAT family N-acetyltransferase [Firmicutes bacterium]|nr:GNAT family N-acetyltransferase [Bacillota bacterium]